MAEESQDKKEAPENEDSIKVMFTCQSCQKKKPLEDMRRIARFMPPLVVCIDCSKVFR
jgi:hypothetical protein